MEHCHADGHMEADLVAQARAAERADLRASIAALQSGEEACQHCGCWNLVTYMLEIIDAGDHVGDAVNMGTSV